MSKKLLTTQEMADILRVSAKTFLKAVKSKNVPFVEIMGTKRFDEEKVLKTLETVGVEPETVERPKAKKKLTANVHPDRQRFREMIGL